jgi:2-amino-4-hydroxy-6-hydroxymethyldihydropteridine diphosphokinase
MILIGIGGNLESPTFGPPRETLRAALAAIEQEGVSILARSGWYQSEPVPRSGQPWFVNAVVSVTTELGACELLTILQAIEASFGRVRAKRNAARILDLDLLAYDAVVMQTAILTVPHPRLHERRFVLVPLVEIAPDWRHPLLGLTARELLARLSPEQQLDRMPC